MPDADARERGESPGMIEAREWRERVIRETDAGIIGPPTEWDSRIDLKVIYAGCTFAGAANERGTPYLAGVIRRLAAAEAEVERLRGGPPKPAKFIVIDDACARFSP